MRSADFRKPSIILWLFNCTSWSLCLPGYIFSSSLIISHLSFIYPRISLNIGFKSSQSQKKTSHGVCHVLSVWLHTLGCTLLMWSHAFYLFITIKLDCSNSKMLSTRTSSCIDVTVLHDSKSLITINIVARWLDACKNEPNPIWSLTN